VSSSCHRSFIVATAYGRLASSLFSTSIAMMPLPIQGSQVTFDGGTFYDVAGNMNQTFTTIVSRQRSDGPLISTRDPDDGQSTFPLTQFSSGWAHACYRAQLLRPELS
jgi:hypothetical protein